MYRAWRLDYGTETRVTDDFTLVVTHWRCVVTNGILDIPIDLWRERERRRRKDA